MAADDNEGKIITSISTEDAIELGRLEGVKQVLRELEEISKDATDVEFLRIYIKARRRSLDDALKGKFNVKR